MLCSLRLSCSLPLWYVFSTVRGGILSCQLPTQRVLFGRLSFKWKLPSLSANMDSAFCALPLHRLLDYLMSWCSQIMSASLSHTFETLSHKLYLDSVLNRITLWCCKWKVKIWTWNSLLLKLETHFLILCKQSKNVY